MNHLIQKIYIIKKVKGPGNYHDDFYSVHVTGLSICNNEICYEDNKRIASRLFYIDSIAKSILKNFFGAKTRIRDDMGRNFGSYIGTSILKKASLKGLTSSSICNIFIRETLRELEYVC